MLYTTLRSHNFHMSEGNPSLCLSLSRMLWIVCASRHVLFSHQRQKYHLGIIDTTLPHALQCRHHLPLSTALGHFAPTTCPHHASCRDLGCVPLPHFSPAVWCVCIIAGRQARHEKACMPCCRSSKWHKCAGGENYLYFFFVIQYYTVFFEKRRLRRTDSCSHKRCQLSFTFGAASMALQRDLKRCWIPIGRETGMKIGPTVDQPNDKTESRWKRHSSPLGVAALILNTKQQLRPWANNFWPSEQNLLVIVTLRKQRTEEWQMKNCLQLKQRATVFPWFCWLVRSVGFGRFGSAPLAEQLAKNSSKIWMLGSARLSQFPERTQFKTRI